LFKCPVIVRLLVTEILRWENDRILKSFVFAFRQISLEWAHRLLIQYFFAGCLIPADSFVPEKEPFVLLFNSLPPFGEVPSGPRKEDGGVREVSLAPPQAVIPATSPITRLAALTRYSYDATVRPACLFAAKEEDPSVCRTVAVAAAQRLSSLDRCSRPLAPMPRSAAELESRESRNHLSGEGLDRCSRPLAPLTFNVKAVSPDGGGVAGVDRPAGKSRSDSVAISAAVVSREPSCTFSADKENLPTRGDAERAAALSLTAAAAAGAVGRLQGTIAAGEGRRFVTKVPATTASGCPVAQGGSGILGRGQRTPVQRYTGHVPLDMHLDAFDDAEPPSLEHQFALDRGGAPPGFYFV
jgi:hypothetical protein